MKIYTLLTFFFAPASFLYADTWFCKGEMGEAFFKNGFMNCTYREFCEKGARTYPDFHIMCEVKGKNKFFRNLGADLITLSPKGDYILGLSNSGLHRHALWLINSDGKLIFAIDHGKNGVKYCSESVTLSRIWFDFKDNRVRFVYDKQRLVDIRGKICNGKEVTLMNEQMKDRLGPNSLEEKSFSLWSQVHDLQQKDIVSGTNRQKILENLKNVPIGVCNSREIHAEFNGKGGWVMENEWGSFSPNTEGYCY